MTRDQHKGSPTGMAPSADTDAQKKQKVKAGRGLVIFLAGFAVLAFSIYIFAIVVGLLHA